MITIDGMNEITKTILDIFSHAEVETETETKKIDFFKTSIVANSIKIYVMLNSDISENIEKAKLISKVGTVLIEKPEKIIKNVSRGTLLVFSIKVEEV